jgi:hypothetical protein
MGAATEQTGDAMNARIASLIASLDAATLREHAVEMRADAEACIARFKAAPETDPTGRYVEIGEETLAIVEKIEARIAALDAMAAG